MVWNNTTLYQNATEPSPYDYNEWKIISKEVADLMKSIIDCYIIPPIVLIGLIGNILSLIILSGRRMRRYTTNIILAYLALIDALFLTTMFLRKMPCLVAKFDAVTAKIIDLIMLAHPLILELIFGRLSCLLSLVICCERFIAVFYPMKVKIWVTPKRICLVLALVTLVVVGYLAVGFTLASNIWYYDDQYNRTMPKWIHEPIYLNNKQFFDAYNFVARPVIFRLLPVSLVILLYVAIILQMRRRKRWLNDVTYSARNTNNETELRSLTKMLMTIVGISIVCVLPGAINTLFMLADDRYRYSGQFRHEFRAFSSLVAVGDIVNSSANFFVLAAQNKMFSAILSKIFCRLRRKATTRSDTLDLNLTISSNLSKSISSIVHKDTV
ncbi:hypothetical protein SNE40_023517 [Patella caerulea]|uniref:G-protein coupled receptors family 1 profile domain-containing protein n=1 Tax=Patella caerulea TaxID=87958 RepID=A0AAN8GC48_PATCE